MCCATDAHQVPSLCPSSEFSGLQTLRQNPNPVCGPHRGGSPGGTLQGLGEAGEARAATVGQEERESITKQWEVWFRKDKGTVTKGDTGTGHPQWHHWPPRAIDISTMKTKASENPGAMDNFAFQSK